MIHASLAKYLLFIYCLDLILNNVNIKGTHKLNLHPNIFTRKMMTGVGSRVSRGKSCCSFTIPSVAQGWIKDPTVFFNHKWYFWPGCAVQHYCVNSRISWTQVQMCPLKVFKMYISCLTGVIYKNSVETKEIILSVLIF